MRLVLAIALLARLAWAGAAADLARAISESSLDPDECYRVRDIAFAKEDARLYLTDGYLIFGRPVADRRITAVFTTDVEGGDAEVLLMPPTRSERASLASYTGSPNMEEHFADAVFIFSDDSYRAITSQLAANPFNRKSAEMGALLSANWNSVTRNLAASFETRLVFDLLAQAPDQGFFAAAIHSRKLGNFDLSCDPRAQEQVVVGQIAYRDNRPYLDIWTSFEGRSFRTGKAPVAAPPFSLEDFRIEAALDADLKLSVHTRVRLKPARPGQIAFPLNIAQPMRITEALVDGRPAEILQTESLRANLIRNNGNNLFLLVTPEPLASGRTHEAEFRGEGTVIHNAGNQVYFVGARGSWYPNADLQWATYDLTFRYPKELDLVTPGEVVSDKTEGDWRVTRRQASSPIRFAGFNLGAYERTRVTRGPYTVEVCANRNVERALEPKPQTTIVEPQPPPFGRRRPQSPVVTLPETTHVPDPTSHLQDLALEIASEMEFMAARFGPPPLRLLTVAPIPGAFGQGFPGLIYLSTLSYLGREERAMRSLDARQQLFFSELLHAHETAHQWWGNVVSSERYQDLWLMEALANYSAMLYVEKRKGARTLEAMLEEYRNGLLKKLESGGIQDSAGPIVLGPRLESSLAPGVWRSIVYGKGSWIMHMLRRRMGDERFFAMLAEVRRRYERKSITTDAFRQLAAGFLPPKSADPQLEVFFDQWVYGTGIPSLKLTWAVKGKAPALRLAGTLKQEDVDGDFSVPVPIEIQFGRGAKPITHWLRSSGDPVSFTVPLRQAPTKVVLDPQASVLRR